MTILEGLNPSQRLAVETTEGYVRVIAGAGSGKTKTLTHRYLYLTEVLGIDPTAILCVTFTNKAANEMKGRIRRVSGNVDLRYVSTFHGFCLTVLQKEAHTIQFPTQFQVIDREDMKEMLQRILPDLNLEPKDFKFTTLLDDICQRKQDFNYLNTFLALSTLDLLDKIETTAEVNERIFYRYLYEQRKAYALDFDDLINCTLFILEENPDITYHWQQQFEYLMVDEFQDIDGPQYRLVSLLCQGHENLFIVGDPDQTIYTWRGAKVDYILNFTHQLNEAQTIYLNENYRSNPSILNVANALIQHNTKRLEKSLIPMKQVKTPVLYYHADTAQDEVNWIIDEIKTLLKNKVSLNEITILYRAHFLSREFEERLTQEQLPYTLYNGIEFYKRKEIKDLLAYLRLILTDDEQAFYRIINTPKRNIGEKRLQLIRTYALDHQCSLFQALQSLQTHSSFKQTKAQAFIHLILSMREKLTQETLTNLFAELLEGSGYEAQLRVSGDQERLDNLAELKQSIYLYEQEAGEEVSLSDYLQRVLLFTESNRETHPDSLKMMTIHTAKGLEFPYVFVCGLNEGIFPNRRATTIDRIEEERRLAYVAYTRAEERLYLSEAYGTNYDGSLRYPSRFIIEIPSTLLTFVKPLDPHLISETQNFLMYQTPIETDAFNIGDHVIHEILGPGIVEDIKGSKNQAVVRFESLETTRTLRFKVLKLA